MNANKIIVTKVDTPPCFIEKMVSVSQGKTVLQLK